MTSIAILKSTAVNCVASVYYAETPLRPRGYKKSLLQLPSFIWNPVGSGWLLLGNRIKIISVLFWLRSFLFSLASLQHFPVATSVWRFKSLQKHFFLLALRGHGIRLVWKNSAWFYSHCLLLVKRGTKQTPVLPVLVRNKLSLWREVHMVLPLEDDLLIKTTPFLFWVPFKTHYPLQML